MLDPPNFFGRLRLFVARKKPGTRPEKARLALGAATAHCSGAREIGATVSALVATVIGLSGTGFLVLGVGRWISFCR